MVLIAIAHVEIWVRLLDIKSKYQMEVVNNKNTRQDITTIMRDDLNDIQQMLCLLNKKGSSEGPSISLASTSLTNRLISSYLIETRDIRIEHLFDSFLKIKNTCIVE